MDAARAPYQAQWRSAANVWRALAVGWHALAVLRVSMGRRRRAKSQIDVTECCGDSHTSGLRFYHDGQVELADHHSDGSLARRFVIGAQYIDERAVPIEGEAGDGGIGRAVFRERPRSAGPRARS